MVVSVFLSCVRLLLLGRYFCIMVLLLLVEVVRVEYGIVVRIDVRDGVVVGVLVFVEGGIGCGLLVGFIFVVMGVLLFWFLYF